MSSLVARFASNVFWLGRGIERAEDLARIIDINETYARDDPDGPNWERVLELFADTERFALAYDEPDARSVLNFYVLDRDNPTSVRACLANARENARSVRHLISTEMWTHINILHGQFTGLTQRDIRPSNIAAVMRRVITDCQTFEGIAEGTFFRGEPWCFYSLGKYIERADQTTRILDMGYDRLKPHEGDVIAYVHWNVLLRSVSGYHAYRGRHPGASEPNDMAAFLLYDDEFPRSVSLCVSRMTAMLRNLEQRHGLRRDQQLEKVRRQLEFSLETGPGGTLTPRRLHKYIDEVQQSLAEVADAVAASYFGYD